MFHIYLHRLHQTLNKLINFLILGINKIIIKNSRLEKIFTQLCSQPKTRKYFKLGSIAYGCTANLKEPTIRLAKFDNYSIYVNIAEPLGIRSYFMKDNPVPWFVSKIVQAGDCCLDIGSNMGHYALFMTSLVGNQGKVFAFEPNIDYYQLIQRSIDYNQYNSYLELDQRALWKQSGEVLRFYLSDNPNNSGTSSLKNHGLYLKEDLYTQVSTITLSDISQAHGISHYKLVKIDVERAEYEVLYGGKQYLENHQIDYVVLETEMNSSALQLMNEYNYYSYFIDHIKNIFIQSSRIKDGIFGDYLLVSPKHIDNFKSQFQLQIYENL